MNLSLEPDIYEPNIKEKGDYIDNIPYSSKFQNGLRCPCGTRKEHVFDIRSSFGSDIKTKTHLTKKIAIKENANLDIDLLNF